MIQVPFVGDELARWCQLPESMQTRTELTIALFPDLRTVVQSGFENINNWSLPGSLNLFSAPVRPARRWGAKLFGKITNMFMSPEPLRPTELN